MVAVSTKGLRRERAARARPVLDDQRLAGVLLEQLRLQAHEAVERAARRPRDQEAHRPAREPSLADGRTRERRRGERGADERGAATDEVCGHRRFLPARPPPHRNPPVLRPARRPLAAAFAAILHRPWQKLGPDPSAPAMDGP
jgi:hypothetical protein